VVLVPTRELSEQVRAQVAEFTRYSHIRSVSLFGSGSFRSQLRYLAHGADVLVSTPGRLVDALHKGILRLDQVKHLVLDEVDRMMELGFGSQLQEIIEQGGMSTRVQDGRQTSFFSATLPNVVRELVENFLGRPCIWVDCTGGQFNALPSTIEHVIVDARPPHRSLRQF
jgi:superfamily II DNA/RNA helicase